MVLCEIERTLYVSYFRSIRTLKKGNVPMSIVLYLIGQRAKGSIFLLNKYYLLFIKQLLFGLFALVLVVIFIHFNLTILHLELMLHPTKIK